MNASSSSPVSPGMRLSALLVVGLVGCGGTDLCPSVSGKTYAFTSTVVDNTCTLASSGPVDDTFFTDGGTSGQQSWTQSGCSITVIYAPPMSPVLTEQLELDGGSLTGTASNTSGCMLTVVGAEQP